MFFFNNSFNGLLRQRFKIDLVGERIIRHNGRGVGVDKHNVKTCVLENAAGLCSGVVKLSRLTDNDGTGTDNKYLFYVFIQRHCFFLPSLK